jgi:hypothetical protein
MKEIPPLLSGENFLLIEGRREGAARKFCFWLLLSKGALPVDRIHSSAGRSQSLPSQTTTS